MTMVKWIGLAAAALMACGSAAAETPAEKGLRIAEAADAFDAGFESYTVDGVMTLRDRTGSTSERSFSQRGLEVADDGDKSLIVFHRPPDIEGTALLTHAHVTGEDDQWLFLPALKRVKRISAANRSGSFVASEFAYEDISSQEVEEFTYEWIAEEPCPGAGAVCHVIDRFPTYEGSGYIRQRVWMDTEAYRIFKIDYYDRKASLLKTLTAADYAVYEGKHWRADRITMANHQTGKSTDMVWSGYAFKVGLDDGDFSRRALQRSR